ncbi:MAG TPA: DUF2975 domain-containing protein [Balneolaceae bacterium]|nr:DUF2975 domain-containing protein [Balneolaceae bacterium]
MRAKAKGAVISFINFWVQLAWAGYLVYGVIILVQVILQVFGAWPFSPPIQLSTSLQTGLLSGNPDLGLHSADLALTGLTANLVPGLVSYSATIPYLALVIARLAVIALLLYGLGRLKVILKNLKDGEPFSLENIAQLRLLAYLVLLITPLQLVFQAISYWYLSTFEELSSVLQWSWQADYKYLLIGLGILLIAEVFRQGYEMYEEQKLTV